MNNTEPNYDVFELTSDLAEVSYFIEAALISCENKEYYCEYSVLKHALKKQQKLIDKINS